LIYFEYIQKVVKACKSLILQAFTTF